MFKKMTFSPTCILLISASYSLLSGTSLSESQLLRLEAVTFLCHWCSYDQPTVTLPVKCDRDVKYTRSKVMKLLKDDVFDPSRAGDLQMVS